MSAEVLRRAAAGLRADVENAPKEPIADERVKGVWLGSAYYLTTTPAVALAVADWLDHQARTADNNVAEGARKPGMHPDHPAFAVARAYLGKSS